MTRPDGFGGRRVLAACMVALCSVGAHAETDPGVRGGPAGAGGPLPGLTTGQQGWFATGGTAFRQRRSVLQGLGPRFNAEGCATCHLAPSAGGSSGGTNLQVDAATFNGALNTLPSFITRTGPAVVARIVNKPDGTPDGSMHALFTIRGRIDAPTGCNIVQEDLNAQLAAGNLVLRHTPPVFGVGLIEAISDAAILANKTASASPALGISGKEHRNGDGTINRFGWKAQHASVEAFTGEALNAELGNTNPLSPHERAVGEADQACISNPVFEQPIRFANTTPQAAASDVDTLTAWMQLLAPPVPSATIPGGADSIAQGRTLFANIGCANCHTPGFTTRAHVVASLSNQPVNLFSDLLLHNMGPGLADRVSQGSATGDQFRTAPLWGLGQRRFFLHDARTTNLVTAIQQHASPASGTTPASEANAVIANYNALTNANRQHVINFLRSL